MMNRLPSTAGIRLGLALTAFTTLAALGGCGAEEEYVTILAPVGSGHEITAYNDIFEVAVVPKDDGALEAHMPDGGRIEHVHRHRASPSEDFFVRTTEVNDVKPGEVISIGLPTLPLPAGCLCQSHEDPAFDREVADVIITLQREANSITRRIRSADWGDLTTPNQPGWFLTCANETYETLRATVALLDCAMQSTL